MAIVIGVRFRTAGKIYFFAPEDHEVKKGDHVIVETARGVEYGTVVVPISEVDDSKVIKPVKPILRIANETDEVQERENRVKEKEAFKLCQEKIRAHGLEMKLIDAEYTFDNNKILFYFTADGRIDFRALVKDLAAVFRTRIELRQIGVRDETKIIGGYGICGRPLCCHSYLSDFIPVSIKMAKEQNLSLNPTKISGACGRLMCCLKNEEEVYEELNKKLPKVGDIVSTDDNMEGEVASVNVLRQLVRILVEVDDEKEYHDYPADQVHFLRKKAKHNNQKQNKQEPEEDLEELKALEDSGTDGDLNGPAEDAAPRKNDKGDNRNKGQRRNSQAGFQGKNNGQRQGANNKAGDNRQQAPGQNGQGGRDKGQSRNDKAQGGRDRKNNHPRNRQGKNPSAPQAIANKENSPAPQAVNIESE
nr:stage 0 sporulation family protein [Butyrivibrio sp. MC2013]